ncbi:MAG: hypothetical protein VYA86_07480 [Candidatus Thermoplasmatota archaeon]|nr:hypothetical protein [Candidatus Thermoplasmatota archaeon]
MTEYLGGILFWGFIIWCFVSTWKSELKGEDMSKFKLRYVLPPLLLGGLGLMLGRAWGG